MTAFGHSTIKVGTADIGRKADVHGGKSTDGICGSLRPLHPAVRQQLNWSIQEHNFGIGDSIGRTETGKMPDSSCGSTDCLRKPDF